MELETVIGLEVHAQLKTQSKMYCSCSTAFGTEPNTQICPVCTGQPGVLPVANHKAVEFVIMTGCALQSSISAFSRFARKQYFYPDMPKNYQISQFDTPLCIGGSVPIDLPDGTSKTISLTRIHLEEDAGKLLHQIGSRTIQGSLVDYNRTGVPLMEIVSEPDIQTPEEAYAYLVSLKEILEYIGVSDCNMEEGKLRCDANISLRPKGQKELGVKTELKNMNSFKHVRAGIAYEINRQAEILVTGGRIIQETRLWDAARNMSESMRSKEESHDYRYFPEPDLVPIVFSKKHIEEIRNKIPELPRKIRQRVMDMYGLSSYDAGVLTADKKLAAYFESTLDSLPQAMKGKPHVSKLVSNWITTELLGRLHASGLSIETSPITPAHMGKLISLIEQQTISGKIAKTVFEAMVTDHVNPETYVQEKDLAQINDEHALGSIADEIIAANKKIVDQYKSGKEQALLSLIGQVMKKTGGRANPPMVNSILKEKLSSH
ncbi:MAG: Asp-tRNA(Asn)/Glu-tRNA(Gln) amidotransferase subunit GatB [bacterium]